MMPKTGKDFQWMDDEAELLLNVAYEYKVKNAAEGVDWESVKNKYDDVLEAFREALPSSPEDSCKDFPHQRNEVTKQILSAKLKNIRLKFRQTIDSRRRSGHGRVVMLYFEICQKIWGGSPAAEQVSGGIESCDLTEASETIPESSLESPATVDDSDTSGGQASLADTDTVSTSTRRSLLDTKLKNYRQEKLKRKIPVDMQLLSCAQEELKIKRSLLEKMERVDKEYTDNLTKLTTSMEQMTKSISDGFAMLHTLIGQSGPVYPHPQLHPTYPYHVQHAAFHSSTPSSSQGPPSTPYVPPAMYDPVHGTPTSVYSSSRSGMHDSNALESS